MPSLYRPSTDGLLRFMYLFNIGSSAIATMVKGEVVSATAILVKWSIVRACSEGDGMVVKYRVHFTNSSTLKGL